MEYLSLLKIHDLKATPQRLAVLQALSTKEHPTIDQLHEKIKSFCPTISLATVYKNVNTLKDSGIVIEINMPDGKNRFDVFINKHLHLVCKNCKNIVDIMYDKDLNCYKNHLEKNIKKPISYLDIVAYVDKCDCC